MEKYIAQVLIHVGGSANFDGSLVKGFVFLFVLYDDRLPRVLNLISYLQILELGFTDWPLYFSRCVQTVHVALRIVDRDVWTFRHYNLHSFFICIIHERLMPLNCLFGAAVHCEGVLWRFR